MPLNPFQVQFEGETHSATFALVSKSRHYGGNLLLTPQASVFEDRLDVCLFQSQNRFRYLRYLTGILAGTHLAYPDVVHRKTRRVTITSDRPVPVQMDGEPAGCTPCEFTADGESLLVLAP